MKKVQLSYAICQNELVHLSEISEKNQQDLSCPYCHGRLMFRRGKKQQAHFAHLSDSCFSTKGIDFFQVIYPPFPDIELNPFVHEILHLIQTEKETLQHRSNKLLQKADSCKSFIGKEMNYIDSFANQQELSRAIRDFTDAKHNELPDLHLLPAQDNSLFHKIMFTGSNYILQGSYSYEQRQANAHYLPTYARKLFEACIRLQQLRKKGLQHKLCLQQFNKQYTHYQRFYLYFLKIETQKAGILYKIGISSRSFIERQKEIEKTIQHFLPLKSTLLITIPKAAFLEPFFKWKYRNDRFIFENHTEYFKLSQQKATEITNKLEKIQLQITDSKVFK